MGLACGKEADLPAFLSNRSDPSELAAGMGQGGLSGGASGEAVFQFPTYTSVSATTRAGDRSSPSGESIERVGAFFRVLFHA